MKEALDILAFAPHPDECQLIIETSTDYLSSTYGLEEFSAMTPVTPRRSSRMCSQDGFYRVVVGFRRGCEPESGAFRVGQTPESC